MIKPNAFNKYLILICILLVTMASNASTAEVRDPGTYLFDQTFGNLKEELETAKEQGKKGILVFFSLQDCPFCTRMLNTVLNQKNVQEQFKKDFLIFEIDIEGETEIIDFNGNVMRAKDFSFKKHKIRATPVFAFFDLKGNRVTRYIGATSSVEEFMLLGKYVSSSMYKTMRFRKYKREIIKQ